MQWAPKNKHNSLLADPPGIYISKTSKDANEKKKVIGAFSRNCLRMQKAPIKFAKFGRWDVALVCGPGSRKHSTLPQSGLGVLFSCPWLPCEGESRPLRGCALLIVPW
jgi:hypothetical protein